LFLLLSFVVIPTAVEGSLFVSVVISPSLYQWRVSAVGQRSKENRVGNFEVERKESSAEFVPPSVFESGELREVEVEELRGFLYRLAAAAAAGGLFRGGLSDQFSNPHRCDELLHSVIVKINRGSFRIRFGYDANSILLVPDCLTFHQNLHNSLLRIRTI
jgi:hypothetical protein